MKRKHEKPRVSGSKLIIFTRYPRPGRVKTRLIPALGEVGAARLHREMADHTMEWVRGLSRKKGVSVEVRYDGAPLEEMQEWLGEDLSYAAQGEGDLGERMSRASREALVRGYGKILLVGTDCPQLNVTVAAMALASLENSDTVVIPTEDGGYCLLGLKAMVPELFQGIEWGSASVFRDTMQQAGRKGLRTDVFAVFRDVDRPEDLDVWERVSRQFLSVIIPTLNEEKHIEKTLRQLRDVRDCEVIVSDGGSRDETVTIALDLGARLLKSEAGRGAQMNAGASAAVGDILLFLHADTLLPERFAERVRKVLSDPEVAGGAFGFKFRPITPLLRITEKTINWRTRFLKLPYGDQAYFVRASLFRQMGGYADIPIMEDLEFWRRLRKKGKPAFISDPVESSSRLFTENGVIRTTLRNKVVFFGYLFGVPPARLRRMYYRK